MIDAEGRLGKHVTDTLLAAAYSWWSEEYYAASWMGGDQAASEFVSWLRDGAPTYNWAEYERVTIARVRELLGLPGTGAGVTPENAADCEPVAVPEPASICAPDDEC